MRLIDEFSYRECILNECKKLKKELIEAKENEDNDVVLAISNQLSAFMLAIKLIDIQPTAYNTNNEIYNKALDDFIAKAEEETNDIWDDDDYMVGLFTGYRYSIEIAEQLKKGEKNGGQSE